MDSIKLKTVFGKEAVIFTLKILTVAEENKLRQRVFGLTEKEQEDKGYELAVNALSEFEVIPEQLSGSIERISQTEGGEEFHEMFTVKDYFAERDSIKERIAHYTFRSWLVALQPDVSFL